MVAAISHLLSFWRLMPNVGGYHSPQMVWHMLPQVGGYHYIQGLIK